MRIGFDAKRAFYNRSGLGNYSRDVISGLLRQFSDEELLLYSPKIKGAIDFLPDDFDTANIRLPKSFIHKMFRSYWRSSAICGDLKTDKPDIYHGLSNELPQQINRLTCKSVVTIHDLLFLRFPELYKPIDRKIYEAKFKYSAQVADKVIAISHQTKNDLVEFFGIEPEKIEILYQSCNKLYQLPPNADKQKEVKAKYNLPDTYILNVGTIEKRKNILSVIQAMKLGKIDVPLYIVGRNTPYIKDIEEFVADNQMDGQIHILNNVPLEDLPAFYQMATLFVYPSIFEGFGIPIIEALFSGAPVLTSLGSCFREAGGPGAMYIDPYHPEEISIVLNTLLTDTDKRKRMRTEGLAYAQNFTEKETIPKLMNLYKSLLR
jgi:glycosyltransferase involved in cell wall biosynthesis